MKSKEEELKKEISDLLLLYIDKDIDEKDVVLFVKQKIYRAEERGFTKALAKVQENIGVGNEAIFVLCNAILEEYKLLSPKEK